MMLHLSSAPLNNLNVKKIMLLCSEIYSEQKFGVWVMSNMKYQHFLGWNLSNYF